MTLDTAIAPNAIENNDEKTLIIWNVYSKYLLDALIGFQNYILD